MEFIAYAALIMLVVPLFLAGIVILVWVLCRGHYRRYGVPIRFGNKRKTFQNFLDSDAPFKVLELRDRRGRRLVSFVDRKSAIEVHATDTPNVLELARRSECIEDFIKESEARWGGAANMRYFIDARKFIGVYETREHAMSRENRNAAIAAALILGGFGLVAFYLPTIMLFIGDRSPLAAGIFGALFVLAFFGVFWLRGRRTGGDA